MENKVKHFIYFGLVIAMSALVHPASGQVPKADTPLVPTSSGVTALPGQVGGSLHDDPGMSATRRQLYQTSLDLYKQAKTQYDLGNLDSAEKICQQAIDAAPVISGHKMLLPQIDCQIGRIYLAQGENEKALEKFRSCSLNYSDADLSYDIALACVRTSNYKEALKHYSDQDVLQYSLASEQVLPQDLPGTNNLVSLEASVLLARGLNYYFEAQHGLAMTDFLAAARLAPNNIIIAAYIAKSLFRQKRYIEATPWLEKVVASKRGHIFHEAERSLYTAQAALKAATPQTH